MKLALFGLQSISTGIELNMSIYCVLREQGEYICQLRT